MPASAAIDELQSDLHSLRELHRDMARAIDGLERRIVSLGQGAPAEAATGRTGAKFDFNERVRVRAPRGEHKVIDGRLGTVLGRAANDRGGWGYAVLVDGDECWSVPESKLQTTDEVRG